MVYKHSGCNLLSFTKIVFHFLISNSIGLRESGTVKLYVTVSLLYAQV